MNGCYDVLLLLKVVSYDVFISAAVILIKEL